MNQYIMYMYVFFFFFFFFFLETEFSTKMKRMKQKDRNNEERDIKSSARFSFVHFLRLSPLSAKHFFFYSYILLVSPFSPDP